MNDEQNVQDAKKSIKAHIKFMETILQHLNSNEEVSKGRAMWTAWCLHRYFSGQLIKDIQEAMEENKGKENAG
jgi:hypothetical protein